MEWLISKVKLVSNYLNVIAGCAMTFMMLLTVVDVILRFFKWNFPGTYELVFFAGSVVVGFAIPLTTLTKAHVLVDVLVQRFSLGVRNVFNITTRLMGVFLFSIAGWNLVLVGIDYYRSGEGSLTLQMPIYPIIFGIGFSCFVTCLVLIVQIMQVVGGTYE
jgi:TRAP-type C4-dicarboxylate transport system permease small subunit